MMFSTNLYAAYKLTPLWILLDSILLHCLINGQGYEGLAGGGGGFFWGNLRERGECFFLGNQGRRDTSHKIHEQSWKRWDWVEKKGNMADKNEADVSYSKCKE